MAKLRSGGMREALVALFLVLAGSGALRATEPPDPEERTRRPGLSMTIPEFEAFSAEFSPGLVQRYKARFAQAVKGANLLTRIHNGLPALGNPKMLVLLIDFDEYPARVEDAPEYMREMIFGAGGEFPMESLRAYYRRASYGKLNIEGEVLGWYRAGRRADIPETKEGLEALVKRALLNYRDTDFSRYDNDGDGQIDYFAVIWTGPRGEWGTFWWGRMSDFRDKSFTVGGKRLGAYSWQGALRKWPGPGEFFSPRVLVHETGHALGLPDYYDYAPEEGPRGGVGYFDVMHSNRYDHNCFSKFMLGWIEPRMVFGGGEFRLRPASESGDCLLLPAGGGPFNPFGEFFLAENRRPSGNDAEKKFPGSGGLVLWHVDATLNDEGTNFRYDNHYTPRKLLKILEADGKEEIELSETGVFGERDFFSEGLGIGPGTRPSSRSYSGADTGITLVSLGGNNELRVKVVR